MVVAIDAMGGDHAPGVVVEGAVRAKRELGLDVVLVGPEELISAELVRLGAQGLIPVVHATELIGMDEKPMKAVRSKRDSTMRRAFELVRDGRAQAVVTAGNSGAAMACGVLVLGRVKGIERPALASVFPTLGPPTVALDMGANLDSQPRHLFQFGLMGQVFAQTVLGNPDPKVGLLSVGEEEVKGNDQTRRAHELFRKSELNFIGNVEGRDFLMGKAQVIVCDGFVGNVCLKMAEGLVVAMTVMLKREIGNSPQSLFGAWLMRRALKSLKKKVNYAEYGGAPLLGVRGACLICHGASSALAIRNAARLAADWVKQDFHQTLIKTLEQQQVHLNDH